MYTSRHTLPVFELFLLSKDIFIFPVRNDFFYLSQYTDSSFARFFALLGALNSMQLDQSTMELSHFALHRSSIIFNLIKQFLVSSVKNDFSCLHVCTFFVFFNPFNSWRLIHALRHPKNVILDGSQPDQSFVGSTVMHFFTLEKENFPSLSDDQWFLPVLTWEFLSLCLCIN